MENRLSSVWACIAASGILLAGCDSQGSSPGAGGGPAGNGGSGAGGVVGAGGAEGTGGGQGAGGRGSGAGGQQGRGGGAGTGGSSAGSGGNEGDASIPSGDGSAGCGASGAPTGSLGSQSITVGDRTRTYVLTVPKGYTPSTQWPVIFAWHGLGGSGSVARSYFRVDTAVAGQAIVVYPDGLPVNDGGTGWDLTEAGIDVAFFDALYAYVSDTYCIDRNRVFTTGHSFGGFFTNILGCYRGEVLRATAPVAGNPPMSFGRDPVACSGQVAALVIHGENDPTVDYTRGGIGGKDFWVGQNGCLTTDPVEITPTGCLEYQSCQPDLPVVFCTHTEQHDWPTANSRACADGGGVCFDGASVIWTFFSRFD